MNALEKQSSGRERQNPIYVSNFPSMVIDSAKLPGLELFSFPCFFFFFSR